MPDFYVSPSGDDANPGTAVAPVRTITRATELAAAVDPAGGTIFVADGVYQSPDERFPILVPPSFALEGATRDGCIVRFTGEARTTTSGDLYWGGVAIHGGRSVHRLTVESTAVPAAYSCVGIIGVALTIDGAEARELTVRSTDPADPADFFSWSLRTTGATTSISDVLVDGNGGIVCSGPRTDVDRVTMIDGNIAFVPDTGQLRDCTFTRSCLNLSTLTDVTVSANTFSGGRLTAIIVLGDDSRPSLGPGPLITGHVINNGGCIACQHPGPCRIDGNDLTASDTVIWADSGASPVIRGNTLRSSNSLCRLLRSERDARPSLSDNIFTATAWGYYGTLSILSPADLGGGGSPGQNHFGPLISPGMIYAALPGGGTLQAQNNFWPTWHWPGHIGASNFVDLGPGTDVRVDGEMPDPLGVM